MKSIKKAIQCTEFLLNLIDKEPFDRKFDVHERDTLINIRRKLEGELYNLKAKKVRR